MNHHIINIFPRKHLTKLYDSSLTKAVEEFNQSSSLAETILFMYFYSSFNS